LNSFGLYMAKPFVFFSIFLITSDKMLAHLVLKCFIMDFITFFLFNINMKQEFQTDTKYARRICGIFNGNDNIFGSSIFNLENRYR